MSAVPDYIDKTYPAVKPDFRLWDKEESRWVEASGEKRHAISEAIAGSERYTVCMNIGQVDFKGQGIYVDQIVKYACNWDYEGGYAAENRVFKKDTKKAKGYHLGIIKFHARTATYVIWPYRLTCMTDHYLIEVVGDIQTNPELAATIEYPYDEKGNIKSAKSQ